MSRGCTWRGGDGRAAHDGAAHCVGEVAPGRYLEGMRTVGLKVLKNKLSEYVRLAEGGEVVLVTDRDRVVAELRPPHERTLLASDAHLADLMRRGLMTAPLVVREGPPPRLPVASAADLLAELDADRSGR